VVTVVLWPSAFGHPRRRRGPVRGARSRSGGWPVASLALGLIVLARREPMLPRRDLPALLVCGLDAGPAAML
jgi:hypothetical protein